MAEEFFGTPMTEVKVKQPPKVRPLTSMKAIRKEANRQQREHRQVMKAARERIKGLNKSIKGANFGRRLSKEQAKFARAERKAIGARMKHARRVGAQFRAYQVQAQRLLRARNAQLKSQIRQHKKQIKALKAKQRGMNPRVKQKKFRREQSLVAKSLKWAWLLKMAKKAFKQKKADGRNHGFTGSGKGGRTGRAGFWR